MSHLEEIYQGCDGIPVTEDERRRGRPAATWQKTCVGRGRGKGFGKRKRDLAQGTCRTRWLTADSLTDGWSRNELGQKRIKAHFPFENSTFFLLYFVRNSRNEDYTKL